ncbi:MAG: hypothetical protein R3B91_05505 [Planctomycetaceae bacterium]
MTDPQRFVNGVGTTALSDEGFDKLELTHCWRTAHSRPRQSSLPASRAEQSGSRVGIGRKGKGTTPLLLTDAHDIPLAYHIAAANENEVNLIEPLLDRSVVDEAFWPSTHLLYDKAADSDPLRS